MIFFIGEIKLYGDIYLQYRVKNMYYIFKFTCWSTAGKTKKVSLKSAAKGLNLAKIRAVGSYKIDHQWFGWEYLGEDIPKQKEEIQKIQTEQLSLAL